MLTYVPKRETDGVGKQTYPITSKLPVTNVVGVVSDAAVDLALFEDYLASACRIEDQESM